MNHELNCKYLRRKYCSNHSICAQVWYCSFCILDYFFVFYHINTSSRLWELAVKLSSDISLPFLPLSRNWLFLGLWQVKSSATFEMHLQMHFFFFSSYKCSAFWSALFYYINMSCIDFERFLLSAHLYTFFPFSLLIQGVLVNWWIQMSPNVPSTWQKSCSKRLW